jgi:hypothetical protein
MGARVKSFFEDWFFVGFEFGPIDLAVFEIAQFDGANGRLLIKQSSLCVFRPIVRGDHDDAMGERFLT